MSIGSVSASQESGTISGSRALGKRLKQGLHMGLIRYQQNRNIYDYLAMLESEPEYSIHHTRQINSIGGSSGASSGTSIVQTFRVANIIYPEV